METTITRIIKLGHSWGIYDSYEKQYLYYINELGELAEAINKKLDIAGELADVFVTMINSEYCVTGLVNYSKPHTITLYTDFRAIELLSSFKRTYGHEHVSALHSIARNHGLDFEKCVRDKLDILEKRTGRTLDGIFIKD